MPPTWGDLVTARYTVAAPHEPADREVLIARLWAAGALGVWEHRSHQVAWFDAPSDDVPGAGRWDDEPDRDWQAVWKDGIAPVVAGDVAVVPTWLVEQAPDVPHVLVIEPGQAFGTGHHATTVLCLRLLQEVGVRGAQVLDVGTGTGVLALAAALLGARAVRAVDTDADAVAVATRNAAANAVTIEVEQGSVGVGDAGRYDVVLANLLTDTVTRLAPTLVGALSPHGALIVSGITEERAAGPRRALAEAGAAVVREELEDGWVGMVAHRSAP